MNSIKKEMEDLSSEFLNLPYTENTIGMVESRVRSILDDGISKGILKPLPELQIEVGVENFRLNISVTEKEEYQETETKESSKKYDESYGFFDGESNFNKYLKKQNFTDGEIKYIENKIRNAMRGKDCIDNFRFYNKKRLNLWDEGYYAAQRDDGCCGFYDDEIKLKSGKVFVFGFNYGH